MLLERELKKLFHILVHEERTAHFPVAGSDVAIRINDNKLFLSTEVYSGGNFIPRSVRSCLSEQAPFTYGHIKTYLTLDESTFQIFLNYVGNVDSLESDSFRNLLEEFGWLANEWRLYLDEHDKRDLLHIRVK